MIRQVSRRTFCQVSATAMLAGARMAWAQPADSSADSVPIIDTHQHLWDLGRFRLAWLADYEPLRRNYLLEDYWRAAEGTPIVRTVYMEVDVVPEQRGAEADYVGALAADPASRMSGAVVGGAPEAEAFGDYVARVKRHPALKGVRARVRGHADDDRFELDASFVAGIRLLGEQDLSFDINVQADQLDRAAALIDRAPDTRYILDHCGNIDVTSSAADIDRWKRGMEDVGRRPQVVCKISGFISNARDHRPTQDEIARVIDHVYECFGPDRVIFASDWPVCTLAMPLRDWVAAVQQTVADRPTVEQRKLFHDNAVRVYRL